MTQPGDVEPRPDANKKRLPQKKARPSKKKKKPSFLQRLRRQDIILLVGLASVACLSVIVISLLILRFQSAGARNQVTASEPVGPQPTHTVTFVETTGLKQYPLARQEAQVWAADAYLASANANWPEILSVDQVGAPTQWTYRFFSPAKERLFIIKVEPNGQLSSLEHVARITLPPPSLNSEAWSVDSPAALATWLDYGGAQMITQNPGLEVLIQLRPALETPNPVWVVIGTDQRTQELLLVVVDTTDSSVVKTDSSR